MKKISKNCMEIITSLNAINNNELLCITYWNAVIFRNEKERGKETFECWVGSFASQVLSLISNNK